jgi:hypothetical protein
MPFPTGCSPDREALFASAPTLIVFAPSPALSADVQIGKNPSGIAIELCGEANTVHVMCGRVFSLEETGCTSAI